jgi:hypothetical protein
MKRHTPSNTKQMVIETTYDSTKILGGGKLHSVFGGGYVLIQ